MDISGLLTDGFERVAETTHGVLDGASADQLTYRPDADANSAAWLIWHLTRVQDDHLADAAGSGQVWLDDGWQQRFGLPFAPDATGYAQSSADVAAVPGDAGLLGGYLDAVHMRTRAFVQGLRGADLDRVVDENWTPPVTLAVRLISVLSDDLQHAGQAAYAVGLARRAGR